MRISEYLDILLLPTVLEDMSSHHIVSNHITVRVSGCYKTSRDWWDGQRQRVDSLSNIGYRQKTTEISESIRNVSKVFVSRAPEGKKAWHSPPKQPEMYLRFS